MFPFLFFSLSPSPSSISRFTFFSVQEKLISRFVVISLKLNVIHHDISNTFPVSKWLPVIHNNFFLSATTFTSLLFKSYHYLVMLSSASERGRHKKPRYLSRTSYINIYPNFSTNPFCYPLPFSLLHI